MSDSAATTPFWRGRSLTSYSEAEWESLCDGCGQCCLQKLEDWDSGNYVCTNISCHLLDEGTARCRNYPQRQSIVPDCEKITPANVLTLPWLPVTCAYRLVAEGKDLPTWHHLISGSYDTIREAGISVIGHIESEAKYAASSSKQGLLKAGDRAIQAWLANDRTPLWIQDSHGNRLAKESATD